MSGDQLVVRQEHRKWPWVVGGAAVLGGFALVASQCSGNEKPLHHDFEVENAIVTQAHIEGTAILGMDFTAESQVCDGNLWGLTGLVHTFNPGIPKCILGHPTAEVQDTAGVRYIANGPMTVSFDKSSHVTTVVVGDIGPDAPILDLATVDFKAKNGYLGFNSTGAMSKATEDVFRFAYAMVGITSCQEEAKKQVRVIVDQTARDTAVQASHDPTNPWDIGDPANIKVVYETSIGKPDEHGPPHVSADEFFNYVKKREKDAHGSVVSDSEYHIDVQADPNAPIPDIPILDTKDFQKVVKKIIGKGDVTVIDNRTGKSFNYADIKKGEFGCRVIASQEDLDHAKKDAADAAHQIGMIASSDIHGKIIPPPVHR